MEESGNMSGMEPTAIETLEDLTMDDATEDRAEPNGLKTGDFVEWGSSGGTARGKITRILRDGTLEVPDSSFSITATEEDPAALIRIYRQGDDGYEETDRLVGHKFSTLSKIAALRI